MSWVVDASVAAKWFFAEELTDEALTFLRRDQELVAPELILLEVGSVAWKRALRGEVTREHAMAVAAALPRMFSLLAPVSSLHDRALELAFTLGHSVYDCCYLALSEVRGLPFVTADARLLEKLVGSGWSGEAVHLREAKP